MESYGNFAEVYDLFMSDVPYCNWVSYIEKICAKFSLNPKLILELGCGTGNISTILSKKGYDVIGVDSSDAMLNKAKEKASQQSLDILYIKQDMRSFELYGTVDLVICLFDSINYILSEKDLLKVFRLVNTYLNPGGLFIFDLNTVYNFEYILGRNSFSAVNENAAYVWENYYSKKNMKNEYYVNFFVKQENGLYERFEEVHYEKAYTIEKILSLLEQSGLNTLKVYDGCTFKIPTETSKKVFFVAKETQKLKNI